MAGALNLLGCNGGGIEGSGGAEPQQTTTVEGAAQKGPFVIGSSITVSYLNNDGSATALNTQTQTKDSIGNFSFPIEQVGPVQIQARGYHLNEITGELSQGELTLRAIYNLTAQEGQATFVNILTHLAHNRILKLMAEGNQVDVAINQAQNEILDALSPVLEKPQDLMFTSLSVYNVEGSDTENNDYLLALSAIVYQQAMNLSDENASSVDAELTLLLNSMSTDLADNGNIDHEEYIQDLNQAKVQLDKDQIETNLNETAIAATGSSLAIPDIGGFLVGMIITSPADEATITGEIAIRTLFPKSLTLSQGALLVDGVPVLENINDISEFSWNPYYWGDNNRHSIMITAEDEAAGEVISNLISVTVSDSVKQLLTLTSPNDTTEFNHVDEVELTWQEVNGASNYEIQVSTSENFISSISTYTTTDTSITVSNLETTTYYWRVRAAMGTQWGPKTNAQSFTISKPRLPSLNDPEVTKQETGYDISLSWEDIGQGNTYSIYLKDVATNTVIEETTSESIITITGLDLGKYEWQLKRINSLGHESDLSNSQEIEVGIFTKYFGGSGDDNAKQVIKSKSGGYIILGSTESKEIDSEVDQDGDDWVIKIDETGEKSWEYISNAPGGHRFSDYAELIDGSVILVGSNLNEGKGIATKLGSDGSLEWEIAYNPEDIDLNNRFGLVIECHDKVMIVGYQYENSERKNHIFHTLDKESGVILESITIPEIEGYKTLNISEILVTSEGYLALTGAANVEGEEYFNAGAYLQLFDTNINQILTWNNVGSYHQINVGDVIELSNGKFAIIGQHRAGGYIAISVINPDGTFFKNYSDQYLAYGYGEQLITPGSNGGFYGLFSDYSRGYSDNAIAFMHFDSNQIATKKAVYRHTEGAARPAGLVQNNDDSYTFVINESQSSNDSNTRDIVLFKRGESNLEF